MVEKILLAALSSLFSSLLTAALLWWRFDKRLTKVEADLYERRGIVQELESIHDCISDLTAAVQRITPHYSPPVKAHGNGK